MNASIAFIVNPASKHGKRFLQGFDLKTWVGKHFPGGLVVFTKEKKHGISLAKDLANRGAKKIIAVGGDGTLSEIVDGLFLSGVDLKPQVGIVATGTGCDFARFLGKTFKPFSGCEWLTRSCSKKVDVGRLTIKEKNKKYVQHFINITEVGLGGEVTARVNGSGKRMGRFSYAFESLLGSIAYKPFEAIVAWDDHEEKSKLVMFLVANGAYFGGGMKIAPDAKLDDGYFELLYVKQAPLGRLLVKLPLNLVRLFSGKKLKDQSVSYHRVKRAFVSSVSGAPFCVDLDGETQWATQIAFEILPKSLEVLLPA